MGGHAGRCGVSRVLALRHRLDAGPDHTVAIPRAATWLNANDRGGWQTRFMDTADWRKAGRVAARDARLPAMERAYVLAELRFGNRRLRDHANYAPTVKAVLDGFVDAEVFPDDNLNCLIGPDLRIGPVQAAESLLIHVWPVSSRSAADFDWAYTGSNARVRHALADGALGEGLAALCGIAPDWTPWIAGRTAATAARLERLPMCRRCAAVIDAGGG